MDWAIAPHYVFAVGQYWLVHKGLFKKIIKVNFLLVGHTHDHIDQINMILSEPIDKILKFLLHYITSIFNNVFFIKWVDVDNTTLLYAKQYLSSTQWEPLCGCCFLLQLPISTIIYGAKQMSYEDRKIFTMNCNFPNKQQFWIQSLEMKKETYIEHAKRYDGN
jgi:hypothetical protein